MGSDAQTVREYIEALASGDLDGVSARLTDDVVLTVPGRNPLSGRKEGMEAVLAMFRAMYERAAGSSMPVEVHDLLESDEHVVALVRRTIGGTMMPAAVVYHLRDGKIAEVWSHEADQYALDEAMGG